VREFIETLPDGWTIYVWMIAAAAILIAAAFGLRWASKNQQFDEDIKYTVFSEDDKARMDPAEYAKSREVIEAQVRMRKEHLAEKAKGRATKS
jgi:hypothetical protein